MEADLFSAVPTCAFDNDCVFPDCSGCASFIPLLSKRLPPSSSSINSKISIYHYGEVAISLVRYFRPTRTTARRTTWLVQKQSQPRSQTAIRDRESVDEDSGCPIDHDSTHLDFSWAPKLLEEPVHGGRRVKVIIIGAGFSGMCAAITLREMCHDVDIVIYDKATDVGGVCKSVEGRAQ